MRSYIAGMLTGMLFILVTSAVAQYDPNYWKRDFDPYDNEAMRLERQFQERNALRQYNEWLERQNGYRLPYNPC